MLKKFIQKSKKVYVILGVGIVTCLLVITANISYELGQKQAEGYSEEYMDFYGFSVFEHSFMFPDETLEHIFYLAKNKTDDYFLTADEKQENALNNYNRAMEEKATQKE